MPGQRRAALTEQDREDWTAFSRHIRPLRGRLPAPPVEAAVAAPPPTPRPAQAIRHASVMPARPVQVGGQPGGLDSASWNRFRTGKLGPTRTLDLHGRTAQRAFHALHAFLLSAQAEGVRCVEIVTGRGSGETGGVLRRELPHWLNQPSLRPLILAATHPHPANPGAVRVLLRRVR